MAKVRSNPSFLMASVAFMATSSTASLADSNASHRSSVQAVLRRAAGRSTEMHRLHSSLQSQLAFAAPAGRLGTFSAVSAGRPGMLQACKVAIAGQRVTLRGGAGVREMSSSPQMVGDHGYDYDYFVIGGGSGGVRSSRIAGGYGKKVALAESAAGGSSADGGFGGLGGTCVNVGCVPKKLMVYGSHYKEDVHEAKGFGWDFEEPKLNWGRFIENKNNEIARLNGIYERMLAGSGVEVIKKRTTLVDAHTVDCEGKLVTADKILVAVGGWPMVPKFEGSEHVISSNEAFFLPELPKRVIVVGGGYIAIEFAAIFNGYGSKVTQIYRGDLWLRGFDKDVREHLVPEYKRIGVDVRFNTDVAKIEKQADGSLKATMKDGSVVETDVIMYATGRVPRTKNLGCEKAGVKLDDNGAIIVDEGFQTSVPSIYAVGDVINRIQLTPVALAEGHCLADTLFGGKPRKTDYSDVPTAVFSQPPVGTCGVSEEAARELYGKDKVHVYKSSFRAMKHTISGSAEKTLMKLVVHAETDKVLGVHMVGDAAGEIIQLAGVCIKVGTTKADWDATIGVHPTSAEEFVTMRTRVPDEV